MNLIRGAIFVSLCLSSAVAQEASLSGTVHDSTGANVPAATVKITGSNTGISRTVQTNDAGVYDLQFLQPGRYNLVITASGFKSLTRTDLELEVAQKARLDFTLEIGSLQENIVVTAGTEAIQTESATLGAVIDNKKVVEMPLNGRQFYSLALLTPGVLPPTQGSSLSFRGGLNIAGSSETSNNFTLNGIANNDPAVFAPNFRPSIDAIAEFNVLTGVYPAEYGYGSGGQVIVTTKSGTNQVHGTVYDFLRNQVMDARNYFSPAGPLPSFKRNQFGATAGGPIIRNKTFFFFSYEGLRLGQQVSAVTTVPTVAMKAGDFSSILAVKRITDPTTGAAFPGNIIPPSRISPVAQALLAYYPNPTYPTAFGVLPSNNYIFNEKRTENMNEYSLRVDHTFGTKDSLYATLNYFDDPSYEPSNSLCGTKVLPLFGCTVGNLAEVYGITYTHIFTPSVVNEARVGYTRAVQPRVGEDSAINFWGPFGAVPTLTPYPGNLGVPNTAVTGYASLGSATNIPQSRTDNMWDWNDSVSITHGKHTLKIGMDIYHFATNNILVSNGRGGLTFSNTSQGPTTTYGMADLLLGLPASTSNSPYQYKFYVRTANISAYLQDTYKVTPTLTLNLGLRWELNTPPVDHSGKLTSFDPVKGIPVTQGSDGFGEHVFNFDWHDYAPRLGFSWQPFHDAKTVVRGGTGVFYNAFNVYNGLSGIYVGYPYKVNNTYTSSLAQPVTLANPFPSANAVTANSLSGANKDFQNPRVFEWSLGLQRALTTNLLWEATYFGSKGNHLETTQNINQPLPGVGTPAQVNARRPYPAYGTISFYQWNGDSHYHSLQTKLQQRFGNGLSFLASYTLGKSIDDTGTPTNAYDLSTARGLSSFDVRHRFVFSPIYELPFGSGKPYLSQGFLSRIVGGWQISLLFQAQTGNPLTPTVSGNYSNSGGTTDRPNVVSNPNDGPKTVAQWFSTSAFALPGQYTFGNAGRSIIEAPGLVNLDTSLVRNFQVREWLRIQFRGEFFNTLNHPNFQFPNVVADNPQFGTISGAADPRQIQLALKVIF